MNHSKETVLKTVSELFDLVKEKQSKVDALTLQVAEMKSRLNDAYTDGQSAMYTARQSKVDELQKRVEELTVGCGLQRDHIKGLEAELKKAWTTVDQEGHKNHELLMLLKFVREYFEMNDLDKAMPRVYEKLEQALKGGGE